MAFASVGADSALVTFPNYVPPMPAVARILSRYSRDKLEAFVSVAIDLLDTLDGDTDLEEDNDDCCPARDDTGGVHCLDEYGDGGPGDPADAEGDDDAEEEDQDEESLQGVTLNPDALSLEDWWLSSGKMPIQGHY